MSCALSDVWVSAYHKGAGAYGIPHLSNIYLSTLAEHGVEISVTRRGCPWENGYAERLIRTLKEEEVYCHREFRPLSKPRFLKGVSETFSLGVRGFDTCRISTKKPVLTLRNCGLNKRMHFTSHLQFLVSAASTVKKRSSICCHVSNETRPAASLHAMMSSTASRYMT